MKSTLSARYCASIMVLPRANLAVLAASAILDSPWFAFWWVHVKPHTQNTKFITSVPSLAPRTRVFCNKMAKSIRSKRKRKLRAQRREQLKPRVKAQLEKTLGLSDKEMLLDIQKDEENKSEVETFDAEDSMIMNNAAAGEYDTLNDTTKPHLNQFKCSSFHTECYREENFELFLTSRIMWDPNLMIMLQHKAKMFTVYVRMH